MGHASSDVVADTGVYRDLQQRLDRQPTGAPDTPAFRAILRLLFTEEEAELAAHLPSIVAVERLAERLERDPELQQRLEERM